LLAADDVCDVVAVTSPLQHNTQTPALACAPTQLYDLRKVPPVTPQSGLQHALSHGQELLQCQHGHKIGVLQHQHPEARLAAGAYVLLAACKLVACKLDG
jgi:hypothetical protein